MVDVVVRAAEVNFVVQSVCDAPIINTSYLKLPFGSGDYPDKLLPSISTTPWMIGDGPICC